MVRRARLASRDPGLVLVDGRQGQRIRGDAAGLADRQRCRSGTAGTQGFEGRTARSVDLASARRRRGVAGVTRQATAPARS